MARDNKLFSKPHEIKKRSMFGINNNAADIRTQIFEKNAAHLNQIVDELTGINWTESKLPKEALEKKSKESQPKGDLQSRARAVINLLTTDNSAFVSVDLSRIDRKLITIAQKFNGAVADGQVRAAEMASYAIAKAGNIRSKVPTNGNTEEYLKYMDAAEDFFGTLICIIDIAKCTDEIEKMYRKNLSIFEEKEQALKDKKTERELLPAKDILDVQRQTLHEYENVLELICVKISVINSADDIRMHTEILREINDLLEPYSVILS